MIKNLIFDFGGILLDLDFGKCDNAFKRLFNIEFEKRDYTPQFYKIFDDYEQGFYSEDTYLYRLQTLANHAISERNIVDAWNGMLVQIPKHRLDFLVKLRQEYKVYLLSNTNFTHIQWVHKYLKSAYGIIDFETRFFDHVYYSYEVKMRKPNRDIYEHVLMDAGLHGHESLFIDDTMINIETAKSVGIHAAWHNPSLDITQELASYIAHCQG